MFATLSRRARSGDLSYGRTDNGARLLGAPISEPFREGNGDGSGRRYLVQWFEKGRLAYHPELAGTRYEVELGLAGLQALRQRGW